MLDKSTGNDVLSSLVSNWAVVQGHCSTLESVSKRRLHKLFERAVCESSEDVRREREVLSRAFYEVWWAQVRRRHGKVCVASLTDLLSSLRTALQVRDSIHTAELDGLSQLQDELDGLVSGPQLSADVFMQADSALNIVNSLMVPRFNIDRENQAPTDSAKQLEHMQLEVLLPPVDELMKRRDRDVPVNTYTRPWACDAAADVVNYAYVMYRLLQEELVGSFVECMDSMNSGRPFSKWYPQVEIRGFSVTGRIGVMAQRACGLKDEEFKDGSLMLLFELLPQVKNRHNLVYLTPQIMDQKTARWVVCENPAYDDVSGINMTVELLDGQDFKWDGQYAMVESPVYYRSFEATFEFLRNPDAIMRNPLSKILLGGVDRCPSKVPALLKGKTLDISNLYEDEKYPVRWTVSTPFPRPNRMTLDATQRTAVQIAFSNRVAIIQGPPGTGKSFVGSKVIETLIANNTTSKPILVLSYTNHAVVEVLDSLELDIAHLAKIGGKPSQWSLDRHMTRDKFIRQKELKADRKEVAIEVCKAFQIMMQSGVTTAMYLLAKEAKLALLDVAIRDLEVPENHVSVGDVKPDAVQQLIKQLLQFWCEGGTYTIRANRKQVQQRFLEITSKPTTNDKAPTIVNRFAALEENPLTNVHLSQKRLHNLRASVALEVENRHHISAYLMSLFEQSSFVEQVMATDFDLNLHVFRRAKKAMANIFHEIWTEHKERADDLTRRIADIQREAVLEACRTKKVIGLTTTSAARNQELVQSLSPDVIVVEEVGEILEPLLMSCLRSLDLSHLILIGDHQQLRPKLNNYSLVTTKYFDISLQERLVHHGMPYSQLGVQHRMRPEMYNLFRHFYPDGISDHPKVLRYARVAGLQRQLFFLTHSHFEQSNPMESQHNPFEAQMACRIAHHIYLNGTPIEEITLLTPYLGQKRTLTKTWSDLMQARKILMRQHTIQRLDELCPLIQTVDNYQGEQNEVVILSLVRSNDRNVLGFVGVRNRILVSLSRGKRSLIIIGNKTLLDKNSDWVTVFNHLPKDNCGEAIPLGCPNHAKTTTLASIPSHFDEISLGKLFSRGCAKPCDFLLQCGHACVLKCHVFSHDSVLCLRSCSRPRPEGCMHKCTQRCHKCGKAGVDTCESPCRVPVPVTLDCGHVQAVQCHVHLLPETRTITCQFKQQVVMDCGHKGTILCRTPQRCQKRCSNLAPCGKHPCNGKCGHSEHYCNEPCDRFLICGHMCSAGCGKPCDVLCKSACQVTCLHGSQCSAPCKEDCIRCVEPCCWKCEHYTCTKLCREVCNRPVCDERCPEILECLHRCAGLCGELCPPCPHCELAEGREAVTLEPFSSMDFSTTRLYILDCKHVFDVETLDMHFAMTSEADGHATVEQKSCPVCRTPVYKAGRYNRYIKADLENIRSVKKTIRLSHQRLSLAERKMIDRAMTDGTSPQYNGAGYSRWYACPNGHPYFIDDCGGSTHLSRCPTCGVAIGGQNYHVASGNTHLHDFAGASQEQAWSNAL